MQYLVIPPVIVFFGLPFLPFDSFFRLLLLLFFYPPLSYSCYASLAAAQARKTAAAARRQTTSERVSCASTTASNTAAAVTATATALTTTATAVKETRTQNTSSSPSLVELATAPTNGEEALVNSDLQNDNDSNNNEDTFWPEPPPEAVPFSVYQCCIITGSGRDLISSSLKVFQLCELTIVRLFPLLCSSLHTSPFSPCPLFALPFFLSCSFFFFGGPQIFASGLGALLRCLRLLHEARNVWQVSCICGTCIIGTEPWVKCALVNLMY